MARIPSWATPSRSRSNAMRFCAVAAGSGSSAASLAGASGSARSIRRPRTEARLHAERTLSVDDPSERPNLRAREGSRTRAPRGSQRGRLIRRASASVASLTPDRTLSASTTTSTVSVTRSDVIATNPSSSSPDPRPGAAAVGREPDVGRADRYRGVSVCEPVSDDAAEIASEVAQALPIAIPATGCPVCAGDDLLAHSPGAVAHRFACPRCGLVGLLFEALVLALEFPYPALKLLDRLLCACEIGQRRVAPGLGGADLTGRLLLEFLGLLSRLLSFGEVGPNGGEIGLQLLGRCRCIADSYAYEERQERDPDQPYAWPDASCAAATLPRRRWRWRWR